MSYDQLQGAIGLALVAVAAAGLAVHLVRRRRGRRVTEDADGYTLPEDWRGEADSERIRRARKSG